MAKANLFGSDLLDVSQSQKRISSQSSRYSVCDNLVQSLPSGNRFNSDLELENDTGLTRSFSADNFEQSNRARDLRRSSASVLQYMHTKHIPNTEVHATHFKSSDSEINRPTPSTEYSSHITRHKTENRPIANQQYLENKIHEKTLKGVDSESKDTYVSVTQSATKKEYCYSKTINTEKEPNIKRQTLQRTTMKHQGMNQNNQNQNHDKGLKSESEKTVSRTSQLTETNIKLKNIQEGTLTMEKSDHGTLATNSTQESGVSVTNYTIYADNSSISVESKDKYFKGDTRRRSHGSASEQLTFIMEETLLIMEKHKSQNVFVRSRAFEKAKMKLELNKLVTISGNPGEGKTALGIELLVFFAQGDPNIKRTPVKIRNFWELRVVINQKKDLIIFFDDLFGSSGFYEQEKRDWQKSFEIVSAIINETDNMIILAMRNQVLNRYREDLERFDIFEKNMIINLNHTDNSFTTEEKSTMLRNHLEESTVKGVSPNVIDITAIGEIEDTFAFPMCCHIFASKFEYFKEGKDFFQYPLICLCRELNSIRSNKTDQIKFIMLVGILLFGEIDESTFKTKSKTNKMQRLKDFAASCKCQNPSQHDLVLLEELENIFVTTDGQNCKYDFINNITKDAVCLVYARNCPKDQCEQALDMLSMDVLCRYVNISNCEVSCVCWHIREWLFPKLALRLIEGITLNNCEKVANHRAWQNASFCGVLENKFKNKNALQFLDPLANGYATHCLLYWVCYREPKRLDFFGMLLHHIKKLLERSSFPFRLPFRYYDAGMYDCLRHACESGNENVIPLLFSYGAKVDDNIIEICRRGDRQQIIGMLLPYRK